MNSKFSTRRVLLSSPNWRSDFSWFVENYVLALGEENSHHPLLAWRKINFSELDSLKNALESMLAQTEDSCLIFAEAEGVKLGYFLGLVKTCLAEQPSRVGYLNGLYVLPEYRKKKIGALLYQAGFDWFKSLGLNFIELYLAEGNESGFNFWKKQGYAVAEKILVKRI